MRPTDRELLVGVSHALQAMAKELDVSERRVQLELAARIVGQVASRLGETRAVMLADCEDIVATLADIAGPGDTGPLADAALHAAALLDATPVDVDDETLEAVHEQLQHLVVAAQRTVATDGGATDAAIRAFHRRSLARRARIDHPFSRG